MREKFFIKKEKIEHFRCAKRTQNPVKHLTGCFLLGRQIVPNQNLQQQINNQPTDISCYFGRNLGIFSSNEISEMEIGLAVGGAFLSSALNVLFVRISPQGDLFKMFQKHKHHVWLLKTQRMTLLGLQAVLTDAQNKQASNPYVSQWLNEIQDAVDGAENLIKEVNSEALRLKAEGQHQNFAKTISNQQVSDRNLCLSDDFYLNIRDKLEDTIETLEELEKQNGHLGLREYLGSGMQDTRRPSSSLIDESDIIGRQNEMEELIDLSLSDEANGKNLTVVSAVGIGCVGKTTLAKTIYNDENVKDHFGLKAWVLLQAIDLFDFIVDKNLNQA